MELLTILNEKEEVIGEKDIKKIYKDGDLHYTVHVYILNSKNEILLQKRNKNKETYPGLWAISTAGHVRSGETPLNACIRELKEELNQDIEAFELEPVVSLRRQEKINGNNINAIDKIYLLRKDLSNIKIQKNELSSIKYMNYLDYKEVLEKKDKHYVPATGEHEIIFDYITPVVTKKTEYTYNLYKDLSIYNERRNFRNYAISIILIIFGLSLSTFYFYFSLFLSLTIIMSIDQRATRKAYNLYKIIGFDKVHSEEYIFYKDYFIVNKSRVPFKALYKVRTNKDKIYLYINKKQAFIVDKDPLIVL